MMGVLLTMCAACSGGGLEVVARTRRWGRYRYRGNLARVSANVVGPAGLEPATERL